VDPVPVQTPMMKMVKKHRLNHILSHQRWKKPRSVTQLLRSKPTSPHKLLLILLLDKLLSMQLPPIIKFQRYRLTRNDEHEEEKI